MIAELKGKSGIYCITNLVTGAMYIGSSVNIASRLGEHLRGYNSNSHLQHSINTYSSEQFEIRIIELCSPAMLIIREQFYLDILFKLDPSLRFNFSPTASSCLGVTRTDETRTKISTAKKGENNPFFGVTGEDHPKYGVEGVKPSHSIPVLVINIKTNESNKFIPNEMLHNF